MSCTPLALLGEHPRAMDRILELESENQTFLDLAEAYEHVTAEIHDIETSIDPISPAYFAQLARQRDEIRKILYALLNG